MTVGLAVTSLYSNAQQAPRRTAGKDGFRSVRKFAGTLPSEATFNAFLKQYVWLEPGPYLEGDGHQTIGGRGISGGHGCFQHAEGPAGDANLCYR